MATRHSDKRFPTDRRARGAYFTPQSVVRYMVATCLGPLLSQRDSATGSVGCAPFRVVDPACGDGAFLAEIAAFLQESTSPTPIEICGVDIHAESVRQARSRTEEVLQRSAHRISPTTCILVGDAILGPGFDGDTAIHKHADRLPGLDWRGAFPDAAAAGGFDVVLGNPPYRREKDAKPLFDQLAASSLGKWRQARMDLWYYFLHRGLDLLKPGGELSFIVNSYWAASSGAAGLIRRLQAETTLRELVLLETMRVFPGVSGRHLILRVQKGNHPDVSCRIVTIPQRSPPLRSSDAFWAAVQAATKPGSYADSDGQSFTISARSQSELFKNSRLQFAGTSTAILPGGDVQLGACFDVRQGIAENPPCISDRLNQTHGNRYQAGEGVFVLRDDEVARLRLSPTENLLLRPYFPVGEIDRYFLPPAPSRRLLYLTRHTAPSVEELPKIARHLARFREILERRRETVRGLCAWWHLHWPREERLFVEPRVLSVQMGPRPQFVYAEEPTFVGFSVNLILSRPRETGETPRLSLATLTGILNSDLAREWFENNAKRRGIRLEINGGVLKTFPLPKRNRHLESQLEAVVLRRQGTTSALEQRALETTIEQVVRELYDLR